MGVGWVEAAACIAGGKHAMAECMPSRVLYLMKYVEKGPVRPALCPRGLWSSGDRVWTYRCKRII